MPISGEQYTFSDENVSKAPDSAGVYALYQGSVCTYVGRAQGGSTTIRTRLKDHKSGREGRCTQVADKYMREVTSSPVTRERELLEEFKRNTGRLPRCNSVMP